MKKLFTIALAAITAAAVLAGCSNVSNNNYVADLNKQETAFDTGSTGTSSDSNMQSNADSGSAYDSDSASNTDFVSEPDSAYGSDSAADTGTDSGSYSMTNSYGETFTVEPGFAYVSCIKTIGSSDPEYSSLKMFANSKFERGKYYFRITGWGDYDNDYINLVFVPEAIQAGDILNKSDFEAQAKAGANFMYFVHIDGTSLGTGDIMITPMPASDMDAAEVEILANDDSCLAFSFYFEASKESNHYIIEGIFAYGSGGYSNAGSYGGAGGADISTGTVYTGSDQCTSCHGSGKKVCSYCSGAGFKLCGKCDGAGQVKCHSCGGEGTYISYGYGTSTVHTCTTCYGRGVVTCTASGCNKGKIYCTHCSNGVVKCQACGGDGKL